MVATDDWDDSMNYTTLDDDECNGMQCGIVGSQSVKKWKKERKKRGNASFSLSSHNIHTHVRFSRKKKKWLSMDQAKIRTNKCMSGARDREEESEKKKSADDEEEEKRSRRKRVDFRREE